MVIARPQNQYGGHLKYTKDDPIFITTLMSDITKLKGKKIEGGDVAMMLKRLLVFEFRCQLPQSGRKIAPCGRCFSELLLGQGGQTASSSSADVRKRASDGGTGETPDGKVGCLTWSVEDVVDFLSRIGLGHVSDGFKTNSVDGHFLQQLAEEDLMTELGLTKLQARKVKSRLPA